MCLGGLAVCAALATSAAAQPKLKIETDDQVWDLSGQYAKGLPIGETAEHEFVLKNVGTEPLEIIEATAEAAFLTTVLPGETIAPGEEGRLKVVFATEGMEPSQIETHIVVKSNDPASDQRPAVLTVKAQVIPKPEVLLVIEPQERDIGVIRPGQVMSFGYTYQNAGSEDFEIYPLYFKDKRFQVAKGIERELLKPGPVKHFQLDFTARPEDAGKKLDAIFIVKTNSKKQPRVICRVKGYVAPPEKEPEGVQIIPMFFGGEKAQYSFRIANNTERAVEVVAARGDEEIKRVVVEAGKNVGFRTEVASEDELKEISFHVNAYYVPPEPVEPEGEGAGSEAAEATPTGEETGGDESTGGTAAEAETPEGGTPEETETRPTGEEE